MSLTTNNINISFHSVVRGKPESRERITSENKKIRELYQDNKKINLGFNWEPITNISFNDLFELITVDGIATTAYLNSSHRTDASFVSRQLIMVDIDEGFTIQELLNDDFYNTYSAGFYTSPSHTNNHHKFRILFLLEKALTDVSKVRKLHQALMKVYPFADESCKDASRIFFGTKNCIIKEKRDNKLSETDVNALLSLVKPEKPVTHSISYEKGSVTEAETLLNALKKHYSELPYHLRRDIYWALQSEIGKHSAIQLMRERWPDNSLNGKYETFALNYIPGKISVGTIVHYIRLKNPAFKVHKPTTIITDVWGNTRINEGGLL